MLRPLFRLLTLVNKEFAIVTRQPLMLLVLVLGPFLIMLVFGMGHRATPPPLRAALSVPPNVAVSHDPASWQDRLGTAIEVVAVTTDPNAAVQSLRTGQVDLAVIVPATATTDWKNGHSATIEVLHDEISPTESTYIGYASYVMVTELNKQMIAQVAGRLQNDPLVEQSGAPAIPPAVVASPFVSKTASILPTRPDFVAFYSPAVLALLLQHLTVTIVALSLVGERLLGTIELYQVAPTSTFGLLIGKYLSYGVISLVIGALLTELMLRFLDVPLVGNLVLFGGVVALLVFASLGIGLAISSIATSQEHAVQLAMLVLLASVFFGGIFLPLNQLQVPAIYVSDILPVTYATNVLQDIMFRGTITSFTPLIVLGGMSLGFLVLNVRLLGGQLRRR